MVGMVDRYSTGDLYGEGIRYSNALNLILRPKASGVFVTEMKIVYNGRLSNTSILHAFSVRFQLSSIVLKNQF